MGARESLNGRKNVARRKVKNGEKSSSRRSLLFFVPYIFFCPFRLSLAPFICPWVSEDGFVCLQSVPSSSTTDRCFLFPTETDGLVPVFSQLTDVQVKSVQYMFPYTNYLLFLTQHPLAKRVLIAGSVHRCTGRYGGRCVVAREQVISSTTYSLSCNGYAPVNFHKRYPSMSTNCDCEGMSGLVDRGRFQMTSLPSSLERKGKFLCCCRSQCLLTGNRQNVRKFCFFYSEPYT